MNQESIKARVLFVDDEPRILTTMRMLFRGQYEVIVADSGQQALEVLKSQPVDVVVSDQRMPGMTGIELLRQVRDVLPGAMRILLTGYSDLNAIIGSINEGEIFRFVNKPWFDEDLIATVARAVETARATQAAVAEESRTTADGPSAKTEGPLPGVLVLDDNPSVSRKIQELIGNQYPIYGAGSLQEAVGLLQRERIGVVISDTRIQDNPVTGLISALKQQRPEVVTVILTERADADSAIGLINQGQIYRFITKPIQDGQCKIMIGSALRQHGRLSQNPVLHRRYEVTAAPAPDPASPSAALIDRVKTLRSWAKRWV